ncbi:MAG: U32 family peptidase, partial [Roseiflexaceae bacterium]|nr:U32 family peptidase [Roseiflexaceae bacterium]
AQIAETGVDAIIVQDVGVARLAKQIAPDLDVHGSTQMSITSAEGVALAQRFGCSRVVLGRELSLDDIRQIRLQTDCELEIFVHGALCVSYSGQCFSSEAWGGRSANRGQCAQACRLPYELIVDGELKPLGEARYLLSPGDLYALQQVPAIIPLGLHALKIEGRYKDADYVALTTAAYRKAVDEAWAGLPLSVTRREELQLEQVFSRGLGAHFIGGTNHQTVVQGRAPGHRGLLMGRVVEAAGDTVVLMPEAGSASPLKPGDGVVFDAAAWRSPEQREEGGRLYFVRPLPAGRVELRFGAAAIDSRRIRAGDLLWRSHDPELDKAARPFTEASAPVARQPVRAHLTAHVGRPAMLELVLVRQPELRASAVAEQALGPATSRALDAASARDQLGRLGGTPYELVELELDLAGTPFAPVSLLNSLRRQAVEQLAALQAATPARAIANPDATVDAAIALALAGSPIVQVGARPAMPQPVPQPASRALHLLVRTPEQLAAAIAARPASITLDYLELYGLRPAVEQVQAAGIEARVASPRVLKPSEQNVVRFLLKLGCTILVRSSGLLEALQAEQHPALVGDFSLNAANALSATSFLGLGLARITPTYDLNAAQIAQLAGEIGAANIEAVAYQHLPVFHTEHCVFCRFLSAGTSYKDCGHPCESHRVALRDTNGREHPVMADVGCRNTVFGAEAQEASKHLASWRAAGIAHYRLEFVHESGEQVAQITAAFRAALDGSIGSAELASRLRRASSQGTTQGSLFIPDGYMTIPLMQ